jgi:hypothetical protein
MIFKVLAYYCILNADCHDIAELFMRAQASINVSSKSLGERKDAILLDCSSDYDLLM